MRTIIERIFWRIPVVTASPLRLAGEEGLLTADGVLCLPGTALAGAFREASQRLLGSALTETLFGTDENGGAASRLYFDDCLFPDADTGERGGVLRSESGMRAAPFSGAVIEPGARGVLLIEAAVYDGDEADGDCIERCMKRLLSAMAAGELRLGARKTRGFGVLHPEHPGMRRFVCTEPGTGEAYLAFLNDPSYEETALPPHGSDAVMLTAELTLTGGFCGERPVIPGSMWNGAFRERAFRMLETICPALLPELAYAWGTSDPEKLRYRQSSVIFDDSPLEETGLVETARGQFSRLTDAARSVERGQMWYGGHTTLCITVHDCPENDWIAGLLTLVMQDLAAGLLSVGSAAASGCGCFSGEVTADPVWTAALREKIREVQDAAKDQ